MKLGAVLALTLGGGMLVDRPEDRIYARVTTAGGDVLEGYLRWDRNEASWADFLDGQKELPWEHLAEAEALDPVLAEEGRRSRSIEAFGVRITWDVDDDAAPELATSAVRFGRLAWLVVVDDRRARIGLKDGTEIELRGGSSDLGRGMRALVVDDARRGEVELRWRDLDRIEFMEAPAGAPSPRERRLHGTVVTRGGLELTGYVAWDIDEVFESDELDGESEDGADRAIELGEIAAIEWDSPRSARVVLRSGEELILRGTNDVNDENRGIEVSDAALGRAIVPWDELDVVTFHAPEAAVAPYARFGGGPVLWGTVRSESGEEVEGAIRWDNDEAAGWELLDGRMDGVDLDIELDRVRSIEKRSDGRGVRVTLLDGRTFELEGSNDVDAGNKGVFVTPENGETVLVKWEDFASVELVW